VYNLTGTYKLLLVNRYFSPYSRSIFHLHTPIIQKSYILTFGTHIVTILNNYLLNNIAGKIRDDELALICFKFSALVLRKCIRFLVLNEKNIIFSIQSYY